MRKLQNQDLIDRYVKELGSTISPEEIKKIVSSPFEFTKDQMESGFFPTIRLKYFGTFMVHTKRAITILNRTEAQFKKGTITEKLYEKRKKNLEAFIKTRE
jgi:nucleoid DNA-binding protein